MEIVDTAYFIAYFKPSDPLHEDAIAYLENLGGDRVVSQASTNRVRPTNERARKD